MASFVCGVLSASDQTPLKSLISRSISKDNALYASELALKVSTGAACISAFYALILHSDKCLKYACGFESASVLNILMQYYIMKKDDESREKKYNDLQAKLYPVRIQLSEAVHRLSLNQNQLKEQLNFEDSLKKNFKKNEHMAIFMLSTSRIENLKETITRNTKEIEDLINKSEKLMI